MGKRLRSIIEHLNITGDVIVPRTEPGHHEGPGSGRRYAGLIAFLPMHLAFMVNVGNNPAFIR